MGEAVYIARRTCDGAGVALPSGTMATIGKCIGTGVWKVRGTPRRCVQDRTTVWCPEEHMHGLTKASGGAAVRRAT